MGFRDWIDDQYRQVGQELPRLLAPLRLSNRTAKWLAVFSWFVFTALLALQLTTYQTPEVAELLRLPLFVAVFLCFTVAIIALLALPREVSRAELLAGIPRWAVAMLLAAVAYGISVSLLDLRSSHDVVQLDSGYFLLKAQTGEVIRPISAAEYRNVKAGRERAKGAGSLVFPLFAAVVLTFVVPVANARAT